MGHGTPKFSVSRPPQTQLKMQMSRSGSWELPGHHTQFLATRECHNRVVDADAVRPRSVAEFRFSFGPRLQSVQCPAEVLLQSRKKRLVAQRPAGLLVGAKAFDDRRPWMCAERTDRRGMDLTVGDWNP